MIRPRPVGSGRPPDSLALLAAARRRPPRRRRRRRTRAVGGARRPTSPARSARSSGWSPRAASDCARRSATGRSWAPAVTPTTPAVIDAGAAFELMHAFALFHDDVMDDAATPTWRARPRTRLRRRARARGLGRRATALRRRRRHPRRRPGLRARRPAARRRSGRGVADVERAAHRAQRRAVPRHRRARCAASATRRGRADLPATRAASTPSSGRCTSAPCWPRPSAPASCSRR